MSAPSGSGYRPRAGAPRRKGSRITSVCLHPYERELLERVAVAEDVSMAEVWRRALSGYARECGVLPADPEAEPMS